MHEISRLSGGNDAVELDFVEIEATATWIIKLGIHPHLVGLSLSNTDTILDILGVSRVRSTIHNWVQKAHLEPRGEGEIRTKLRLMRRSSRSTGGRFWLGVAVEPSTNHILHSELYTVQIQR